MKTTKTLVTEQPFRSQPEVNTDYDMIRITIDMDRWTWFGWRKILFPPKEETEANEAD